MRTGAITLTIVALAILSGLLIALVSISLATPVQAQAALPGCADSNDFDDGTLDGWTVNPLPAEPGTVTFLHGSAAVTGGEVALTVASSPSGAFVSIGKVLPTTGDFSVTADFTQLGADGTSWRHGIYLLDSAGNWVIVHDADSPILWAVFKVTPITTALLFGDVAGTAGIENTLTTLKITRQGSSFNFDIVRGASVTNLGTFNIPEFTSLVSVRLAAFGGSNTLVNANVDNFKIWTTDVTAETCQTVIQVDIDIKPGSDPNCFNSNDHGVIPVAILGSAGFDASTVDPFSVELDGQEVRVKGKSGNAGSLEDVNNDGFSDLVVQIIDNAAYEPGDTIGTVTGVTFGGMPFEGTDSVCITQ